MLPPSRYRPPRAIPHEWRSPRADRRYFPIASFLADSRSAASDFPARLLGFRFEARHSARRAEQSLEMRLPLRGAFMLFLRVEQLVEQHAADRKSTRLN